MKKYIIIILALIAFLITIASASATVSVGVAYPGGSNYYVADYDSTVTFEYSITAPFFQYPVMYKIETQTITGEIVETLMPWTSTQNQIINELHTFSTEIYEGPAEFKIVLSAYATDDIQITESIIFYMPQLPTISITSLNSEPFCINENIQLLASGGASNIYEWGVSSGECYIVGSNDNNPVTISSDISSICVINVDDTGSPASEEIIVEFEDCTAPVNLFITHPNEEITIGDEETFTVFGGTSYIWEINTPNICQATSNLNQQTLTVEGLQEGNCIVTVEDISGATAQDNVFVIDLIIIPEIIVTHPNPSIYISQEETFTATGGTSYVWEILSGDCEPVSTLNSHTFTIKGLSESVCEVKATDISGEYGTDSIPIINTTGIINLVPQYSEKYPNQQEQFIASGALGDYEWGVSPSNSCSISSEGSIALVSGSNPNIDCNIIVQDTLGLGIKTATLNILENPSISVFPSHSELYLLEGYNSQQYNAYGGICGDEPEDYEWSVMDLDINNGLGLDDNIQLNNGLNKINKKITNNNNNNNLLDFISNSIKSINKLFSNSGIKTSKTEAGSSSASSSNINLNPNSNNCIIDHDTGYLIGLSEGECLVTAKDRCSTATGTATVKVNSISEINVIPPFSEISIGETVNLFASGAPSEVYEWDIISGQDHCSFVNLESISTLSSSENLKGLNSNSLSDTITVKGESIGTCMVRARDLNIPELFAFATIEVTIGGLEVSVLPSYSEILVNENQELQAFGGLSDDYRWSIVEGAEYCSLVQPSLDTSDLNAEKIKGHKTENNRGQEPPTPIIQPSGQNIIVHGDQIGICTIRAVEPVSGLFGFAIVNITDGTPIDTLEIIPDEGTSLIGGRSNVTASHGFIESYSWSILSSFCAITENHNNLIEVTGFSLGVCLIEVEDSGETATAVLNITEQIFPSGVYILPSEVNLTINETQQFTAFGGCSYIWATYGTCSINQNGFLTALSEGQCEVYAFDICSQDYGYANVTVTLDDPQINIQVFPAQVNLTIGETQQFTATGGCGYNWSVQGPCSISQDGLLETLDIGVCYVVAEDHCSDESGLAIVNVIEDIQQEIIVEPNPVLITVGETQQFTATGGCDYIWSVEGTCAINENGFLTAHSEGQCIVTAFDICSDLSGSAIVTVVDSTGVPISAQIISTPSSGVQPLDVHFEGVGQGYGELTYEWFFGNQHPLLYGKNIYKTFTEAGNYPVTLKITDELGRTAIATTNIHVLSYVEALNDPRSRITINSIMLINEGHIFPGCQAEWLIQMKNNGKELEQFRISAVVPELGIYTSVPRFDFKNSITKILTIDVPCDVSSGIYDVRFSLSNYEFKRTVHRDFIIE